MSWWFEVEAESAEMFAAAADAAFKAAVDQHPAVFAEAEVNAQVSAAIAAAVSMVKAGVVGVGPVFAVLSGHANPGHAPRAGWANDEIRITLQSMMKLMVVEDESPVKPLGEASDI